MYLLSNTKVIDALIAQHQAGHDVKVLLNETFPSSGSNSGSNSGVYAQLQSAVGAANVKYAPGSGSYYTHEKGVMIDGATAWIMTMNATQSSPTANREYLAVDTDPADVAEAEAIFQADFANQSIVPKGKLVVAPTNAHLELTGLIGMAKSTVDMEAEELSDAQILSSLEAAGDRGVKVHVVLADTASTTAAATLKQHGVQLVTFSGYYVHAKSIVVDGAYAYVGSENFSGGSLGYNRELGVLTNTASEVAKVEKTTQSDFAAGTAL
jgi:phosphatidylserine/phosphatidylglycerophosphate/cardiolipin synthase-like enzyme